MRQLIAPIVGGIVVFVWSAIAHMATPLGTAGVAVLPNETPMLQTVKHAVPRSGLYIFPAPPPQPSKEQQAAWESRYRSGPVGILVIQMTGTAEMPRLLAIELLGNILAAGVAVFIVSAMSGSFLRRATAVAAPALFASLSLTASYWNWYGFPTA